MAMPRQRDGRYLVCERVQDHSLVTLPLEIVVLETIDFIFILIV
jgi:hypothetical protein